MSQSVKFQEVLNFEWGESEQEITSCSMKVASVASNVIQATFM